MLEYKSTYKSRRVMYDDYEFEYHGNDYNLDEDYTYNDLDEDYGRDSNDYESLAYRHYA